MTGFFFLSVIGNKTSSPSKRSGGRHSKLAQRAISNKVQSAGDVISSCPYSVLPNTAPFPITASHVRLADYSVHVHHHWRAAAVLRLPVEDIFVFPLKTRHVVEETHIKISKAFSIFLFFFSEIFYL